MLVAKYTCNTSGIVPSFNSGYVYEVNEVENNGIYTVEITSDTDFSSCSFNGKSQLLTVEYLKVTSKVTNMSQMFRNCSNLTSLDVSNWDTSKVTSMYYTFQECNKLTQLDLSNFNTNKVISLMGTFYNCSNLISLDVSNWDTSNVNTMNSMFWRCYRLRILNGTNNWDVSSLQDTQCMFISCENLTAFDMSGWIAPKLSNTYGMFSYCRSLTTLDISGWSYLSTETFYDCTNLVRINTHNRIQCNNLTSTFFGCSNLTSLDVSNFDTSNVTNMNSMFNGCSNLTSLDLSNWDTSNVTTMESMFGNCTNLTSLDLSNFDTSNVTNMQSMFDGCTSLRTIGLIYANIDIINRLPTPSISTLYIDANIDQTAYIGNSKLEVYKQSTVTINIPTALRSNEEIADRIYWNDEDKHYYIEQNINPNTNETLETPNIIASGIKQPIYLKTYENELSVGISNIDASYMSVTVPFFEIPDDYEYKWEEELDYIKQSFELRFPDEDDVPNGWGFMGVGEEGTGLKALIDWVDKCTDEEFVRDFDQHFNRDYTLRYFLLVITLG